MKISPIEDGMEVQKLITNTMRCIYETKQNDARQIYPATHTG